MLFFRCPGPEAVVGTQAMKATEGIDMDLLRSLAEVAMMKGFRGGKLEEAIAALEKYDSQQARIPLMG
ncbi:unnamed protein product [Ectocarpus sp. CCAP 1310/34]|nr:unnamed protein product [Ectocarpus sp. CCAP 1310/34]